MMTKARTLLDVNNHLTEDYGGDEKTYQIGA
jgi:hypothetical protein